jgi:glycosyltransferase involved in cell wall biosynthesis
LVNGENCLWPGASWVHYVHHAWRPGNFPTPVWFRFKHRLNQWLAERGENAAARISRLFITNSKRTSRDLVELLGIERERIHTVYLGAETEWGPVSCEERAASRKSLGVAGERSIAAFVGSLGLDQRKGFDTLLEAWTILCCRQDWDVDLLVAGSGQALKKYRNELPRRQLEARVRILGFSKHVREVLAASDLLISPVRYEAYGLNVQEAICRGIPAIVSETAGVAERYDQACAPLLLRDPEDVNALVEACLRWRANRDEWARHFRILGEQVRRYGWRDMAHRMVAIIESEGSNTGL